MLFAAYGGEEELVGLSDAGQGAPWRLGGDAARLESTVLVPHLLPSKLQLQLPRQRRTKTGPTCLPSPP